MSNGGSSEQFAGVQAMLRAEVQARLGDMCVAYSWGADVRIALAAPGKLLATATPSKRIPQGFWGLLPHEVAQYCATSSRDTPRISRLAVACEFLLCALDYFDELEDNDSSETRTALGDGRLLNCATALYQEALQILTELDDEAGSSSATSPRLMGIASAELRRAMSGQHLDLLSEHRLWDGFAPETCIEIIEAKSGTLCRMVCRLACAVVGASGQLATLFAELGTDVGIAAQLENDIHDLESELQSPNGAASPQKTDLLRSKKTFPLVLAYQATLQKQSPPADIATYEGQDQQWTFQVYEDAIQQAWATAIFYRLSAAVLTQPIEQLRGKVFPPKLHAILGIDLDAI
jgi:geranylgeranyl pyrophosphate synthase